MKNKNVFLSDEMYLPIEYKGILIEQPVYEGAGEHSINQLQEICKQFKEYVHQQQIIKQNAMKHIVDLREAKTQKNETTLEKTKENLKVYEKQIGIDLLIEEQKLLRYNSDGKKGKYWMALSPSWVDTNANRDSVKTKYDIMYWVNYGDNNTYGWFTVEQIIQWLLTPELELHTIGGTKER